MTPNPTLDELRAADLQVNGDIGAAQDEIVRRLSQLLPLWIEEQNAQRGWTGAQAIPVPTTIDIAPVQYTTDHLNGVFVGIHETTKPQGIGGAFQNVWEVTITSLDALIETGQQIRVHWKRAEAIKTCLFPFLTGCTNPEGVRVWRLAQPQSIQLLATIAPQFSGTQTTFTLIQPPGVRS